MTSSLTSSSTTSAITINQLNNQPIDHHSPQAYCYRILTMGAPRMWCAHSSVLGGPKIWSQLLVAGWPLVSRWYVVVAGWCYQQKWNNYPLAKEPSSKVAFMASCHSLPTKNSSCSPGQIVGFSNGWNYQSPLNATQIFPALVHVILLSFLSWPSKTMISIGYNPWFWRLGSG